MSGLACDDHGRDNDVASQTVVMDRRWAESIGHDCIHGHFQARFVAINETIYPHFRALLTIGGVLCW